VPIGLVYAQSGYLADIGAMTGECKTLASALGPTLQRRVGEYRALHGLSAAEESMLKLEVCDATLLALIPPLATRINRGGDIRGIAGTLQSVDDDVTPWSVFRFVWSPLDGLGAWGGR